MRSTKSLRNQAFALLAADTTTLAEALGPRMYLAQNNFAPSENSVIGDVQAADFDGFAAIHCTPGTQPEGYDPTTLDSVIDLSPPVGGFRWITTGVTHLPETIYGFYLTNAAGTVLLASQLFDTPIVLTAASQVIDLGDARLRLLANSIS
jgi:hypothetical protein